LPLGGPVAVGSGGTFPSAARGVQVKVQKNVPIVLDRLIGISGILTAATSTAALVPASPPSPTPPVLPVAVNLQNDFALAMNTGAIYDLLAPTTLPPGALTPLLDFGQSPAAAFAPGGRPPDYGYSQHPPLSDDPTGPSSIFTNLQLWSDARHAPALLSLGPSATLSLAPPPPLANSVFMDPEFTAQQLDAYKDAFAAGLRDTIRQQGRTDASGSAYGLVLVPLWDSAGSGTVHVAGAGLIRLRLQDVSSSSAKGRFLLYPAAAWGVPPATAPTPDVGARLVRLIA
jgi:hypothetical protein